MDPSGCPGLYGWDFAHVLGWAWARKRRHKRDRVDFITRILICYVWGMSTVLLLPAEFLRKTPVFPGPFGGWSSTLLSQEGSGLACR